jgi:Protein of unknown function (DUF4238)
MAGKRHHVVPRFLQKGFASRTQEDKVFTWLYHKSRVKPKEVSTTDTLVSEYFYGKGETDLISPLIDSLRGGTCDLNAEAINVAKLIGHLSIRPKLIRKGFEDLTLSFASQAFEVLSEPGKLNAVVDAVPDTFIKEQFDRVVADPPIADLEEKIKLMEGLGISRDSVSTILASLIRVSLNDPEFRKLSEDGFSTILDGMLEKMSSDISEPIRHGHIKALMQSVVPQERVDIFNAFDWSLRASERALILGDTPCIFLPRDSENYLPYCDIRKIELVLLPISKDLALVGESQEGIFRGFPENISQIIAGCSYEQFISSEQSEELVEALKMVGTNIKLASDEEIDAEIEEIRNNIKRLIEDPDTSF